MSKLIPKLKHRKPKGLFQSFLKHNMFVIWQILFWVLFSIDAFQSNTPSTVISTSLWKQTRYIGSTSLYDVDGIGSFTSSILRSNNLFPTTTAIITTTITTTSTAPSTSKRPFQRNMLLYSKLSSSLSDEATATATATIPTANSSSSSFQQNTLSGKNRFRHYSIILAARLKSLKLKSLSALSSTAANAATSSTSKQQTLRNKLRTIVLRQPAQLQQRIPTFFKSVTSTVQRLVQRKINKDRSIGNFSTSTSISDNSLLSNTQPSIVTSSSTTKSQSPSSILVTTTSPTINVLEEEETSTTATLTSTLVADDDVLQTTTTTTTTTTLPIGNRWEISNPNVDLTGEWSLIVTDTFKTKYDKYLEQLGQSWVVRSVAQSIIGMTTEIIQQTQNGKIVSILGKNVRGEWDRTLISSGTTTSSINDDDYKPLSVPILSADSERVNAESWWENNGTIHISYLHGVKKYGGGIFESKRYLEDNNNIYVCESTFIPNNPKKEKASVTWRFRRIIEEEEEQEA